MQSCRGREPGQRVAVEVVGEACGGQVWGLVKYQKCFQGVKGRCSPAEIRCVQNKHIGGRLLFPRQVPGPRLWASPSQMAPHGLDRTVHIDSLATKRQSWLFAERNLR